MVGICVRILSGTNLIQCQKACKRTDAQNHMSIYFLLSKSAKYYYDYEAIKENSYRNPLRTNFASGGIKISQNQKQK
jgi:spore coat polysaccharide biosynthesis protein SpsF (cytidylyltransferase family)